MLWSALLLLSLMDPSSGFSEQFTSSLGRNCSAINVGTTPEANDIIVNGDLVAEPKIPAQTDRHFTLYLVTANDTPFHYVHYDFVPSQLIFVTGFLHTVLDSSQSVQVMNITCDPEVCYDVKATLGVNMMNCKPLKVNFEIKCGTGIPKHRQGLTVAYRHGNKHESVVNDGVVINPQFMEANALSVESLISEHVTEIIFDIGLTGVAEAANMMNMTHEDAVIHYQSSVNKKSQIYEPPYLIYEESMVYPVVGGSASPAGTISEGTLKELKVKFNCLGLEGETMITLQMDITGYKPLQLYIGKKCSKESWLDKLEEAVVMEEQRYGFIKIFLIILLFIAISIALIKGVNELFGVKAPPKKEEISKIGKDAKDIEMKTLNESTVINYGSIM